MERSMASRPERRILAVVLPDLLNELALQRSLQPQLQSHTPTASGIQPRAVSGIQPRAASGTQPRAVSGTQSRAASGTQPRAVVLADLGMPVWDAKTQLDAVNSAARQRGVFPGQTIAHATAIVGNLCIHPLPRACVAAALKQVAEVALAFGSPVSLGAPDTVWVDVSGSSHLFNGELELGLELRALVQALGYTARVAIAGGPWLAQSFARHSTFDALGVLLANASQTSRLVGELPIFALPIERECVTWFSRLGLLSIDDLRKLPQSALAGRLTVTARTTPEKKALGGSGGGTVLDLIQGRDDGVLVPYHPEEMPFEELRWDEPLESIEPLLFVLKGLAARLSARLEGRGQAVQDLLLTIHYDRSIAALRGVLDARSAEQSGSTQALVQRSGVTPVTQETATDQTFTKQIPFRFASPLVHADDLERVVRSRLQRQTLQAPAVALSLQATSVTDARHWQLDLQADMGLAAGMSSDPRSMAVLEAELAADIGDDAVGVLVVNDSHLPEKNSALVPMSVMPMSVGTMRKSQNASRQPGMHRAAGEHAVQLTSLFVAASESESGSELLRLPTRFLATPIELKAPMKKNELWVIREQPFVIGSIHFDQRLEAVEWWDSVRVFRDYFRVWLTALNGRSSAGGGMEVLAYVDRENGRSYVQALYD
jgi:protein ImuB